MALRKQALGYGDEASQYGFELYKEYKKQNRGGLKGAAKGAALGAKTGAGVGSIVGSFIPIPGVGTAVGTAAGALAGGYYGGIIGGVTGNRKMKKEYLKYAKEMTEKGMADAYANSDEAKQEEAYRKAMAEQKAAEAERQRALYSISTTQPIVGGELPMYKKGGVANMVMINVEKGELAVDPRTMKVIMDFNDMPKHPKGKDVINQKGNVKVPVGTIIIPADMRRDFLKAEPGQRIEMAAELIERQREGEEKEMEENEGMEEQAMPQGMGMAQEQMPQGQGMMAMMGGEEGEEEEGGEEMGKMSNGGYVKKYAQAGMVTDDVTTGRTDFNKLSGNVVTPTNASIYYDPSGNPYSYNAYGEAVAIRPGTEATYDPTQNVRELSTTQPQSVARTAGMSGTTGGGLTGGLGTSLGMIGAAIPQYYLGKKQAKEAQTALTELQKQKWAKYLPTAELEQQKLDTAAARERAKYGFSTAELGARQQQVAQAQRTAYQRARESGLSGAGQATLAALGSQRLQALNEMAIQDQRLREQKAQYADSSQRSLAQQYQALANQQTAQDIRYRTMQEQAYGGALKAGLENQYGAFSTAGAGLGYGLGAGIGSQIEQQRAAGQSLTSLLALLG